MEGESARAKIVEELKNLGLIFIPPRRGLIGHVFPTKKYPEGSGIFESIRKRRDPNPLEPPTSASQFVGESRQCSTTLNAGHGFSAMQDLHVAHPAAGTYARVPLMHTEIARFYPMSPPKSCRRFPPIHASP